jgi:hypothetical protein
MEFNKTIRRRRDALENALISPLGPPPTRNPELIPGCNSEYEPPTADIKVGDSSTNGGVLCAVDKPGNF